MHEANHGKSRAAVAMEKAEAASAKAIAAAATAYGIAQQIRGWTHLPALSVEEQDAMEKMEAVFNLTTEWNSARLQLAAACDRDVTARMNNQGDVGETFDALSERNIAEQDVRASRSNLKRVESAFKQMNWPFVHLELQPHLKGRSK